MKIGGFKTGHCYHKPSDAAIQHKPNVVMQWGLVATAKPG